MNITTEPESVKTQSVSKKKRFLDRYNEMPRALQKGKYLFIILGITIPILHFLVFYVGVNVNSIIMAFQRTSFVDGAEKTSFTWENFETVFKSFQSGGNDMIIAMKNTLVLFFVDLFMMVPIFLIAYAFSQNLWWSKFYRVMLYLPSIISAVAFSTMITSILQENVGALAVMFREYFGWDLPNIFQSYDNAFKGVLGYCMWAGLYVNLLLLEGAVRRIPRETLDAGHQIMLFINRRGFAPIVQCKKCGWVATCPDCSVGMTYHKNLKKLLCHMCGRTATLPEKCPNCNDDVSMRGAGLEKIQEEVNIKFPNAKTALVSSDTMMSRQALERLVSKMENGEIDVVIGTQILAKGHHFPNLTLVGVVDADMGLFGTDFRAAEHTFQQLFQVAGRAGRGGAPGRVLLQTYQPEHPVLRAICAGNRDDFMLSDMNARRAAKMPPYGQLIAIIVEAEKEPVLQKFCSLLSDNVPLANGVKIMGPIAAQIYQIRNWYRMRFLVAGDAKSNLQEVVRYWLGKVKTPANVRLKIDVNPQNFI